MLDVGPPWLHTLIVVAVFVVVVGIIWRGGVRPIWQRIVRPTVRAVNDTVDSVREIKGLLVTDAHGLGIVDRLDHLELVGASRDEAIDGLRAQVDVIAERSKQLVPNDGHSMADQLARVDEGQHVTQEKVDEVHKIVNSAAEALAKANVDQLTAKDVQIAAQQVTIDRQEHS